MSFQNPFNSPKTSRAGQAKNVKEFHVNDDLDSADLAHHHTLGPGPHQAAKGSDVAKLLAAVEAGAFGRVGDYQFNDTLEETDVWKRADGQLLNIADYPEAFALYGVAHGGDGVTTFGLPDTRERVLAHYSSASLLINSVGDMVGGAFVNLSHTHEHTHTHALDDNGQAQVAMNATAISIRQVAAAINPWADTFRMTGAAVAAATRTMGAALMGRTAAVTAGQETTTGLDFTNNPAEGIFGDPQFVNMQPTYATNCFVRVKLGV